MRWIKVYHPQKKKKRTAYRRGEKQERKTKQQQQMNTTVSNRATGLVSRLWPEGAGTLCCENHIVFYSQGALAGKDQNSRESPWGSAVWEREGQLEGCIVSLFPLHTFQGPYLAGKLLSPGGREGVAGHRARRGNMGRGLTIASKYLSPVWPSLGGKVDGPGVLLSLGGGY